MKKRTVFFLSDRTGITAEVLGQSLLTQFDNFEFQQVTVPFIQTKEKAQRTHEMIERAWEQDGVQPILFATFIDEHISEIFRDCDALFLDFFATFIGPLEQALGASSSHTVGRAHGIANAANYQVRIDAMNFALENDDGITTKKYDKADVILLGVSRSGKTPTCLYLALQYGIYAANYPLTPDDLEEGVLPKHLEPFRHKLFGLTIEPTRLQQIRAERRANSQYAAPRQCQFEVRSAEQLYRQERLQFVNTTTTSIEEIATTIVHGAKLERRFY